MRPPLLSFLGVILALLILGAAVFNPQSPPVSGPAISGPVPPAESSRPASAFIPAYPAPADPARPAENPPSAGDFSIRSWGENILDRVVPRSEPQYLVLELEPGEEDPAGISDASGFLDHFGNHQRELSVSGEEYAKIPKDEQGIPLLPTELVEAGLLSSRPQYAEGAAVYRTVLEKQIEFFKAVPAKGEAAEIKAKAIAVDRLTVELIGKFESFRAGDLSRAELQDFLQKFQATAARENRSLQAMGPASGPEPGWVMLAERLGLGGMARAAYIPFGGPVTATMGCFCPPFGLAVAVGPPKGGMFYLTIPFLASPLFFPFRSPRIGSLVLGVATVPPASNAPPYCPVLFPVVISAGTSAPTN